MSFLNALDISASGMTAQRFRLDIASENIANMGTTRTENGGPYRRKMVVFEAVDNRSFRSIFRAEIKKQTRFSRFSRWYNDDAGVRVTEVVEDERPFEMVYDPEHPDADENGYVRLPNVDLLKETVDSMAASRAYDANLTCFNTIKAMSAKALEIGK